MLRGALYNLELNKRNADKQALEDAKTDIGWVNINLNAVIDFWENLHTGKAGMAFGVAIKRCASFGEKITV